MAESRGISFKQLYTAQVQLESSMQRLQQLNSLIPMTRLDREIRQRTAHFVLQLLLLPHFMRVPSSYSLPASNRQIRTKTVLG